VRDRRGSRCRSRSSSGQKALASVLARLDNFADETSAAFCRDVEFGLLKKMLLFIILRAF
jgi:hypothetical protein